MMDILPSDRCLELLDEALYGDLAMVADGEPYVTPISFVLHGDGLFIRSGPGRRISALRTEPAVCLSVVAFSPETGEWESVLINGDIEFVEDPNEQAEVVALLLNKYRAYEPAMGVALPEFPGEEAVTLRLGLDQMTGRNSGGSLAPRTRPGRL